MARKSYRVTFPGGSGFNLAGIIDRPDEVDSFPVAVFSHCFTCNKDLKATVRISRALAERGIGVLRFDKTGLGGSQGDFSNTNFSTNLADLQAAIDFASNEMGQVRALIGHSFGGAACLTLAGTRLSRSTGRSGHDRSSQRHPAFGPAAGKDEPGNRSSRFGVVTIGDIPWTISRQMLADFRSHDLPATISRIKCPTLLFHSPADQTLSFDHAIRIMGLIQNSPVADAPVSLISLPGADHLLATSQPDLDFVTATIAAFLWRYAVSG